MYLTYLIPIGHKCNLYAIRFLGLFFQNVCYCILILMVFSKKSIKLIMLEFVKKTCVELKYQKFRCLYAQHFDDIRVLSKSMVQMWAMSNEK